MRDRFGFDLGKNTGSPFWSKPQIGRRLARTSGIGLLPAALTGAVLLQSADLIAQLLLSPVSLPVGVVTTAIGGCYLIWLLSKEVRNG